MRPSRSAVSALGQLYGTELRPVRSPGGMVLRRSEPMELAMNRGPHQHPCHYIAAAMCVSCLTLNACSKHSSSAAVTGAAVAPPIAALPLAASSSALAGSAPPEDALPPPHRLVPYALPPVAERYHHLDRAYAMGDAFAGTPPDYTVDYGQSRPWIWRAQNGAYRIVERLPSGERVYYYDAGERRPFLVRDPDYSYAYRDGELVGIYDGAEAPPKVSSFSTINTFSPATEAVSAEDNAAAPEPMIRTSQSARGPELSLPNAAN